MSTALICAKCEQPILPGEPRIAWFTKDAANVTTDRGAVHVTCPDGAS